MSTAPPGSSSAQPAARVAAVLIEDDAQLDVDALAHACCVGSQWVVERVEAGLLETFGPAHDWCARGAWCIWSKASMRTRSWPRWQRT